MHHRANPSTAGARRRTLLQALGLPLLYPVHALARPAAERAWPQALQVPGGVARLSLGPAP